MDVLKLRIDGQMYYLPADYDVGTLKEQILAGATGTPAFVTFSPVGYGDVTVLMTPTTPVRFEIEEHPQEEVEGWEENPPDIDLYGFLAEH